jgi:lipopolysaccharide biosynthesis protein
MNDANPNRKLVVVLGMHRSGTSAITRGLQAVGVGLGDKLMPPMAGVNEKGFWEDLEIVDLNVEMLAALKSDWHFLSAITGADVETLRTKGYVERAAALLNAKLAQSSAYGFKDPRTSKLLPFWVEAFKAAGIQPHYVLAIRNPMSIEKSLAKRDAFDPKKSYLLWIDHVVTSLAFAEHERLIVIDYDRLMQDPDGQMNRLSHFLGTAVDQSELDSYKSEFLDTSLRHTVFGIDDLHTDPNWPPLLQEVYTSLLSASEDDTVNGGRPPATLTRQWVAEFDRLQVPLRLVDTLHKELVSAYAEAGNTKARLEAKLAKAETIDQQLREHLATREEGLRHLENLAERQKVENAALLATIQEIYASNSWRATSGLRFLTRNMSRARRAAALAPAAIRQKGGIVSAGGKALSILRKEGLHGVRLRMRVLQTESDRALAAKAALRSSEDEMLFVPLYVDPLLNRSAGVRVEGISVAVHLHLSSAEALNAFTSRMAAFDGEFDLFVSLNDPVQADAVRSELARALPLAREILVESEFPTEDPIVPFAIQFGERLSKYDVVGHFFLKADATASDSALMDLLIGPIGASSARLAYILQNLRQDAQLIYPDGVAYPVRDTSFGVTHKHTLTARLLSKHPELALEAFPVIHSPNGSMFWARGDSLQAFFKLPVAHVDDAANSLLLDDHLGYALERLLPILASRGSGRVYRIFKQDSIDDYSEYEAQRDYTATLVHKDIKVLSYYLPQFHPTPLNDEWHGEGFTEWTKVGAAQPLFKGHYQQHIPHDDIGYYLLDSADTLRTQAEQMKKAGVYGQVFYHYWFSGQMILENPAKMLLANPDVEMPYCFCWANENWTRRWDGNEREILLGQTYSAQDARDFINYLIPFFKDARYIRIDDRPVLMVYRPSSIPDCKLYLDMWAEECGKHGLPAPYVVAVLTRGATDPKDFGMDAGTERVLHDWTGGAVENMKGSLTPYRPINGSVLPYNGVADFYTEQTHVPDFTYFRCLVPQWDNTARYGSEALVVHDSTPRKFQSWLENLVDYSQRTLPEDRRFIVVNAWNEWAEGAHLEPDSRYGYSYLNSIGRALSNIPYDSPAAIASSAPPSIRVHIALTPQLASLLDAAPDLARRFNHCLTQATLNTGHEFTRDGDPRDADFTLRLNGASLFDATTISQMIDLALASPDSVVIPNAYDRKQPIFAVTENGAVDPLAAHIAPMVLLPTDYPEDAYKNVRMAQGAHCFAVYPSAEAAHGQPRVTTIIRFHPHADFEELRNALYCLAAMRNCVVTPMIAAQDLDETLRSRLDALLAEMSAVLLAPAVVVPYQSDTGHGDLRSKMLNESLRKVQTRYAAFLDYDDLLLPHAYEWLIRRLATTGKAIAFGRVYSTAFNSKTGGFLKRERAFEYGYTYADFLSVNHAPLHSFMLDVAQLDFSKVIYHDDQKYMEDYYLTLQLFREHNADWASLAENMYIGDYIHSVDRNHTLAFADDVERQALLMNGEYQTAERRIHEMRRQVAQGT